jgi:hypothetical protein
VERVKGIEPSCLLPRRIHWEIRQIAPENRTKRGYSTPRFLAVDGKKLRGGQVEMVNATTGAGRFLGATVTADKSNEIVAARTVLRGLDLIGKTVVARAAFTRNSHPSGPASDYLTPE